jgi:hypothetical protein
MFRIQSFDEYGQPIEVVNVQPAFYGLYFRNTLLGYFITIDACRAAAEDYMTYPESIEGIL